MRKEKTQSSGEDWAEEASSTVSTAKTSVKHARAGLLTRGSLYSPRLPIPPGAEQWPLRLSSPLTAAGP